MLGLANELESQNSGSLVVTRHPSRPSFDRVALTSTVRNSPRVAFEEEEEVPKATGLRLHNRPPPHVESAMHRDVSAKARHGGDRTSVVIGWKLGRARCYYTIASYPCGSGIGEDHSKRSKYAPYAWGLRGEP
ncbi:hypothetical protein ONZ51_g2115 [Trametes cubensis]|uniref:Uncharacterized protein n=1 Tax=Trametes cubensis TaxID=1111947 RepID=A0AAD7U2X5_9APHY|nr:hypothetical protein ONZ51_g2115 [Trametes cubensis]